ncbi:lytic transglycosylase domain-containing protein [Pseudonocardia sp. GCM10023141]|uniref:lytic transglycosylase domain-containing protein n=1 Tax=Pseudonocardia sp. GCM10023141 TaxID=3252653 RepID=UPI00361B487F
MLLLVIVALGTVVVLGFGALALLVRSIDSGPPAQHGDGLTRADVERNTPVVQPEALPAGLDVVAWAATTAQRTGVGARALQAYAAAEIAQRARTPNCRLSWVTLAGVGRVESLHGRIDGSRVDADGGVRPSVVGVPLDGTSGTRPVPDTDGGALDGDASLDRAVGPMQFLPATWARYGADGNGDGVRDPNQFDDAARGAAAYLCAGGRDMGSGKGWWDGVLTYNRSTAYAQLVWAAADRYSKAP